MDQTTEKNNAISAGFSEKSALEMLEIINAEDKGVAYAVEKVLPALAEAAEEAVRRLASGGRMFYFGAGTSGRLGIIDAGELPCTYGIDGGTVQAVIAGGPSAVYDASMGDEDSYENGFAEIAAHGIGASDVVVGITASGRTPYVLGAVEAAKQAGALTIGICNNPGSPLTERVEHPLAVETGPEVIEGSTRMKAGTAQKMILNMLSTVVMTRLGYVYKNYMVRMVPNNEKLYARAVHIVKMCTDADEERCETALRECGWKIDRAIVMLLCGTDAEAAGELLNKNGNSVGKALKAAGSENHD